MKIKISDLVNKVINREEMPKKVLFDGNIYKLDEYGKIEEIRFIGDPDDLNDDYIIK